MKKVAKILVAAVAFGFSSLASAATISLTPTYLGSIDNASGTGTPPAELTNVLTAGPGGTISNTSSTIRHWFAVDATFSQAVAGEDLRFINFDVTANGFTKISRTGSTASTAKYLLNGAIPSTSLGPVFSNNSDLGTAGDLLAINAQSAGAANADEAQFGEGLPSNTNNHRIGYFVLQYTGGVTPATVTVGETGGGAQTNFSYWTGNSPDGTTTFTTTGAGVTPGVASFVAGTVPEPASIGGIVLGMAGLIRRRRA